MRIIKVHCGSAHVRGKAKDYPYFVASVFGQRLTQKGKKVWVNLSTPIGPYRSFNKTEREAQAFASANGLSFRSGYGSLHHQPVEEEKCIECAS